MDSLEFVSKLKDVALHQNLLMYKKLYAETVLDEKIKADPFWGDPLTLYNSLNIQDRDKLFKVIELTIIDTTSTILGIIDGSVTLDKIEGNFLLKYYKDDEVKDNKESDSLSYLQDEFINLTY